MNRPRQRRGRYALAGLTASIILILSAFQLFDRSHFMRSFVKHQSASFYETSAALPRIMADKRNGQTGNFTFWSPQPVVVSSGSDAGLTQTSEVSTQMVRQILTSQTLPRRHVSRNLCGAIPKTSPKAIRFPRILSSTTGKRCSANAIVYMVQKGKHSSYNRNSTALFLKSLDKLYEHYLSINQHSENSAVLIFHSGDYTPNDLDYLDRRFNHTIHFKLIDLNSTDYWTIPESVRNDNISNWNVYPEFSVGYRHMIRWYALKLYDFLRDFAESNDGCQYNYLMRMDEDSFFHSPIQYDLFDFMHANNYSYSFRMCAYEFDTDVWDDYVDHIRYCSLMSMPDGRPFRLVHRDLCAFYNNFFVLEVRFIYQPEVQYFLQWNDAVGIMYRERYNDLQIQAIAVYAFLPPERIHRFLDFTYEHMTYKLVDNLQCSNYGAIQAGYLDTNVKETFLRFRKESNMNKHDCPAIRSRVQLVMDDLSPSYSHLSPPVLWNETFGVARDQFRWKTFAAGSVEGPFRGIMSG